jgi:hypothetical protein
MSYAVNCRSLARRVDHGGGSTLLLRSPSGGRRRVGFQFEYDDSDGEVRPIIEWAVEDGTVTSKQLGRAIFGLVQIVDQFYPVLEQARTKGKIDMALGPFGA